MKNLVYLLFLALVAFGTAGYFLNWYQFSDSNNTNGHRRLMLDIDANKIKEDVQKGEAKLNETLEKVSQQEVSGNQTASPPNNTSQKQLNPPQLQPPKQ